MEDLDGPKTVADKVARQAKIRVFKQFSYGVVAYVATTLAVILLPIFVSPEVCAPRPPRRTPPPQLAAWVDVRLQAFSPAMRAPAMGRAVVVASEHMLSGIRSLAQEGGRVSARGGGGGGGPY